MKQVIPPAPKKSATRRHNPEISPLQRYADASPTVVQLQILAQMADFHSSAVAQMYRKQTVAGQDGEFIPAMRAPIHCHVGRQMRNPHLKISGTVYNFRSTYDPDRLQAAYNALVRGPGNDQLEGYDDCKEYLESMGCAFEEEMDDAPRRDDGPTSAYDDPNTPPSQKERIERGLAQGQYPPN